MKLVYLLIAILLPTFLSSCKFGADKETLAELEKARNTVESLKTELATQSEKWQTQSEKWQTQVDELSEKMVETADRIDPIAIKEIYRDKKELEEILKELEKRLGAGPSQGIINFGNQQIELLCKGDHSSVEIEAWIETVGMHPSDGESINKQPLLHRMGLGSTIVKRSAILGDAAKIFDGFPSIAKDTFNNYNTQTGDVGDTKERIARDILDDRMQGWYQKEFKTRLDGAINSSIKVSEPHSLRFRDVLNGNGYRTVVVKAYDNEVTDYTIEIQLSQISSEGQATVFQKGILTPKNPEIRMPFWVHFDSKTL